MRIGFVGCGAIGSCYASYLLQKHEVCVLDTYEPVIEAIKKNGVLLDKCAPGYGNGENEAYYPTIATTDPKEIGVVDLLVVFVHYKFLEAAVRNALPMIDDHTMIMMPADYNQARKLVRAAAETYGPMYLRFTRDAMEQVYGPDVEFEIGKAYQIQDGKDVAIIANGDTVSLAIKAAKALEEKGVSARVLDMHTIKPLDVEAVKACVEEIGKIVTVEDHNIINGLGSAVCEVAAEMGKGKVKRIGIQDQFGESAPYERLLAKNGITVVIAVSEGVKLADGRFVCELSSSSDKLDAFGHKQLSGVGAYLASLVTEKTGVKARSIEFSTLQRCASHVVSRTDADEAYNAGYIAAQKAFEGNTGEMITIKVESRKPYIVSYNSFDIHEVANVERKVPLEWIINDGTYVSDEFVEYARPLIMGEIEPYYSEGVPQHLTLQE